MLFGICSQVQIEIGEIDQNQKIRFVFYQQTLGGTHAIQNLRQFGENLRDAHYG